MTDAIKPEVLIARLTSENEAWRVDAEQRLVALGAAAVGPLRRALQHAMPSVRLHAVRALAKLGDPSAIDDVVAALGDSENSGAVAIAAERALVEWGAPVRDAVLEAALRGPAGIRPRALRALGKIGGEGLQGPLTTLLGDPVAAIRLQAAVALVQTLGRQALGRVAPLLGDADKWVRYGVAEALVQLGSARGRKVLEEARDDPEERGTHTQFWAEELLDDLDELERTGRVVDR